MFGNFDFAALAKSGDMLGEKFDTLVNLLTALNEKQERTNELLSQLMEKNHGP